MHTLLLAWHTCLQEQNTHRFVVAHDCRVYINMRDVIHILMLQC